MEALKKQEIDYYGCTAEQWVRDAAKPVVEKNFAKHKLDSPSFNYIGWNEKTAFFSDRRVRTAMAYAVPRADFLKHRLNALGKVVSGPFYVNSDAYDRSIEPLPFDLEKSRQLLDEAGWKDTDGDGVRDKGGKPFKFQLLLPSGRRTYEDLGITVSKELKKIGVVMTIRGLDWASFIKELDERNYEAVTLGWQLDLEEDPYQLWHSSQTGASGSNFVYFASTEADRLIEESRTEFDENKRNALFRRLHRILHEEQPYTFLFNTPSLILVHNRFENVIEYPLQLELLDWWVPANRQKYR
jgi:peptide/nickel transport system substrate-binding protein